MEYESRRDADDAYHEMHNKRLGRDDLLKIEVSSPILVPGCGGILTINSGLVLLPLLLGALTLVVTAVQVVVVRLAVEDALLLLAAATTLPEKMIDATTIGETATVTAPEARMIEIVR